MNPPQKISIENLFVFFNPSYVLSLSIILLAEDGKREEICLLRAKKFCVYD